MRRFFVNVKAPPTASAALMKNIQKVAQEAAPQKQSWTAKRAFNLATFESQFKPIFDAEWNQKPASEKGKNAHLKAHERFMRTKFEELNPEEKAHWEQQAQVLNAEQEADQLRFVFVYQQFISNI